MHISIYIFINPYIYIYSILGRIEYQKRTRLKNNLLVDRMPDIHFQNKVDWTDAFGIEFL